MILSLFSGCGGLDLGFEQAGFDVGLAYDIREHSIGSWRYNRKGQNGGFVADINQLSIANMDRDFGATFAPTAVIGGPPCQSFSRANSSKVPEDPRSLLVEKFCTVALELHSFRHELDFIAMENVPELAQADQGALLNEQITRLERNGFIVTKIPLNAVNFGVPQKRDRLFVIAINRKLVGGNSANPTTLSSERKSVREAIGHLPEPIHFSRGLEKDDIPHHQNHWCMKPKSPRFFNASLTEGYSAGRSFKTLAWDEPSITVSYGHREVHVHPKGHRRLSVYEAMLLQGFPKDYVLCGPLSAQIDQVSEAVPPPLAKAVADSIRATLDHKLETSKLVVA